jgi:NAD-dependent dihydropyrimidine dehydrogenase PreA subunit
MKVVTCLFSPTGGTAKAAQALTQSWEAQQETLDLTDPKLDWAGHTFQPEDLAVLAVPSFGGRVPAVAAERLGRLKGNGALCVLLCVYGNRAYEDTLVELEDAAIQSGFRVIAAVAAVAEHSIVHQYAAGRPDEKDKAQLQAFAAQIWEKVRQGGVQTPSLPGGRPYKKAGGGGLVPKAGKSCTHCGRCALRCPVGAIDPVTLTADGKKCFSCMRCVTECPTGARQVNAAMVAAASLALKKVCSVRKECELYL